MIHFLNLEGPFAAPAVAADEQKHQWGKINTPVACLFFRKEMGFGDKFYNCVSKINLYQKNKNREH